MEQFTALAIYLCIRYCQFIVCIIESLGLIVVYVVAAASRFPINPCRGSFDEANFPIANKHCALSASVRMMCSQKWLRRLAAANALHDELVHIECYAFRHHPELMERVNRIVDQKDDAEVIHDINALAKLGMDNRALLDVIGVSPEEMIDAANTSFELGEQKPEAVIQQSDTRHQKKLRDQAYTLVKNIMTEIRECGQYVIWKNPESAAGYKNGYFVKCRKRRQNEKNTAQEMAEASADAWRENTSGNLPANAHPDAQENGEATTTEAGNTKGHCCPVCTIAAPIPQAPLRSRKTPSDTARLRSITIRLEPNRAGESDSP